MYLFGCFCFVNTNNVWSSLLSAHRRCARSLSVLGTEGNTQRTRDIPFSKKNSIYNLLMLRFRWIWIKLYYFTENCILVANKLCSHPTKMSIHDRRAASLHSLSCTHCTQKWPSGSLWRLHKPVVSTPATPDTPSTNNKISRITAHKKHKLWSGMSWKQTLSCVSLVVGVCLHLPVSYRGRGYVTECRLLTVTVECHDFDWGR
jgi:hypothetical protein